MNVAFVPSAPFLLLSSGPAELREAIDAAMALLHGTVVVVGAAPVPGWWEGSVDLTPYGGKGLPTEDPLPLALAVGRALLGDRPHRLWGVPAGDLPPADSYLVVADGTAKRTAKAPGHLDPRAEAYDEAVAAALGAGDGAALLALDEQLGAELWVGGLPAWRAVAGLGPAYESKVRYAGAPYGVGYVVASWRV